MHHILLLRAASEFYERDNSLSLITCSTATLIVTNSLKKGLDLNWKPLPLVIALTIGILRVPLVVDGLKFVDFFWGTLNGFLIYSTALGVNETASSKNRINRITNRPVRDSINGDTQIFSKSKANLSLAGKVEKPVRLFFTSWIINQ